ncbi:MAG TPA: hypothetical protein VK420_12265, partial [Longimicrobium sp.]|nr:hypothetical protein [Longimicrobium sp.]
KGIREDMPGTVSAGVLTIRPGDRPEKVWHPYLESHPADRVDISAATRVWFVTRVRLHGPVGVQAGLDYWQKLGYGDNRNEEANATDWEYRQGEWITLRIEPSTEVPSPIELSPPSANGTYPVGQPITGAFFLRNSDDDPIRLDEMGIETRHLDDPYCDPVRSTKGIHSFGWTGTLNLAPGSLTNHSAQWTPAAAGDYCIRVVERRSGVPGYQQPYASSPFITVRVR